MLDGKLFSGDVDAVADIVWMLDEQKDAGTEDFLSGCSENEGQ
jgi:hypothetical protein